ncbi:hypothetical protein AVEN_272221-1, partial [Araneus ventricosus]
GVLLEGPCPPFEILSSRLRSGGCIVDGGDGRAHSFHGQSGYLRNHNFYPGGLP